MLPLADQAATLCETLAGDDARPSPDRLRAFLAQPDNFAWCRANELVGAVALRAADRLGWRQVPHLWRNDYELTERRISAYLAELDEVAGRLAAGGIRLAILKNGGIARAVYPHLGACPMGDLDALVERSGFREAHRLLLAQGYHFEFRSHLEEADLAQAEVSGGAEYWKLLADGQKLWLELQWRPVAGRWIQPDQEPQAEDLMARSLAIPGTAVRLLAPEDNLLQVALHTAKHSYVRAPGFRLHLDVERIVRAYPELDWDDFVAQATALRVKTAVYFSLAIPSALLGTPIPEGALAALRPAHWKEPLLWRSIESAGLFHPGERKFGRLHYLLFTALLYDGAWGLARGIFPAPAWLRDRYRVRSNWLLPYYYLRRLVDLAWRRAKT